MSTPLRSAVFSLVDPQQVFVEPERSPTGRPTPFSYGCPEPAVSSLCRSPHCTFSATPSSCERDNRKKANTYWPPMCSPTGLARLIYLGVAEGSCGANPRQCSPLLSRLPSATNVPFRLGSGGTSCRGGAQLRLPFHLYKLSLPPCPADPPRPWGLSTRRCISAS